MRSNRQTFPHWNFREIVEKDRLPFADQGFDSVFALFVLEHVVWPDHFIRELARITRRSGEILIVCPDFHGRLEMASQVLGRSGLSGREKLQRGQCLQAIHTTLVGRVLAPRFLRRRLANAAVEPVCLMNARPSCFEQEFYADADAVYVTHQGEIDTTFG